MTKLKKKYPKGESFRRKNQKVEIRVKDDNVEIVVGSKPHKVRFLDNGRPFISEYVDVMATSVRDLAERFVDFTAAQEAHWAEVDKARSKQAAGD